MGEQRKCVIFVKTVKKGTRLATILAMSIRSGLKSIGSERDENKSNAENIAIYIMRGARDVSLFYRKCKIYF